METSEYNVYASLAAAVVEQAIKDYRQALIVKHFFENVVIQPEDKPQSLITAEKHIKSCERFFGHKELFSVYCSYDGLYLQRIIQQQANDSIARNHKRQLTQEQWDNRFNYQENVEKPKSPRSDYQHEQYLKRKAEAQARKEKEHGNS